MNTKFFSKTVYVNLDYDEKNDALPVEGWISIDVHGLTRKNNAEHEAIMFALDMYGESYTPLPNIIYTSFNPQDKNKVLKKHFLSYGQTTLIKTN